MRRPAPDGEWTGDQRSGDEWVGGLQTFDLGMTPASVTPPPTWRHAARFVVIASGGALGGLVLATSALIGYFRWPWGMDLPHQPSGNGDPPLETLAPVPATPGDGSASIPRWRALTDGGADIGARQPARLPMVGGVVPHRTAGAAPNSPAPNSPVRPPVPDLSAGEAVHRRCDQYFAALQNGDLRGAYAMTSDPLHADGFPAFAARYAAATSIQITEIAAGPVRVVATVRITWADGTVETQRRELWFSPGENPVIVADEPVL